MVKNRLGGVPGRRKPVNLNVNNTNFAAFFVASLLHDLSNDKQGSTQRSSLCNIFVSFDWSWSGAVRFFQIGPGTDRPWWVDPWCGECWESSYLCNNNWILSRNICVSFSSLFLNRRNLVARRGGFDLPLV